MKVPLVVIMNKELESVAYEVLNKVAIEEKVRVIDVTLLDQNNAIVLNNKGLACIPNHNFEKLILENPAIYVIKSKEIKLKDAIYIENQEDIDKLDEEIRLRLKIAKIYARLPRIDCKKCGRASCYDFAVDVALRNADIKECVTLFSQKKLVLKVKNELIFLNPWLQDLVRKTVLTMLSSLKGVKISGDEKLIIEVKEH